MAFLEQFSREDLDLLVSLPYRVGLWISASDRTGGHSADDQEREALERAMATIAGAMFESAMVHEVMAEAFLRKQDWTAWSAELATVTDECRRAIRVMTGRVSQRDVDAYRNNLMRMALTVARAFREDDRNEPWLFRLGRGLSVAVDRVFGALQGEKFNPDDILNISYDEDQALNDLAKALRGGDDGESARISLQS